MALRFISNIKVKSEIAPTQKPSRGKEFAPGNFPRQLTTNPTTCRIQVVWLSNKKYLHRIILPISTTLLIQQCDYRGPWCKNERHSWNLDENNKYLPEQASLLRRRTILSINRIAANRTATPWRRKMGAKMNKRGIFRAALGVPWDWSP